MLRFFKRRNNLDASSIGESAQINISDSVPILNRNQFDLTNNTNSVSHDLRRNTDSDVSYVSGTLRTFSGVFCPVALSMSSVAIFMRIGFIVGETGIYESFGLYALAFSIFVLTGLSICAISTNGAIQGGGVYYMISRTLGPEFGGSIGTLFFFANAIGSAFNAAGLVEAFLNNFGVSKTAGGLPETGPWKFLYGSVLNIITLIIALLGANLFSLAIMFIFLVMVGAYITVALSIMIKQPDAIFIPRLNTTGQFTANYTIDYQTEKSTNFAYMFSLLFSSLTGVMAGANMSGELKKPSRSIPLGTMSAIAFVFFVYFFENLLLAASCDRFLLLNYTQVLQDITVAGIYIVPIGILSTTFSGELSALIGSSRVLKALSDDEIFGPLLNFVKVGRTKSGNPWVAVLITFFIAELVLLVGSINAIAPLVTIFYLLAYFGVNLACLALDLASTTNFRPTFKYFSWHTALLGMVGSISMTFIVSVEYASISIGLLIALITVLYFRDFPPEWGSISQALIFHQVRKYLLLLDTRKDHVKFWRPQILLLIANPRSCLPLIDYGNDVKKGGLFVLGNVKVGQLDGFEEDPCAKELPVWMSLVDNLKVKAFVELTLSSSLKEGMHSLIRISGLGGMKPNTVMMGFYDNAAPEDLLKNRMFPKRRKFFNYGLNSTASNNGVASSSSMLQFEDLRSGQESLEGCRLELDDYVDVVRDVLKMKKNLCVCRRFNTLNKDLLKAKTSPIYIDVWPMNFLLPEFPHVLDSTSLFMLQLACIMNMVSVWKRAVVRVFLCIDSNEVSDGAQRKMKLEDLLTQLRIHALCVVVPIKHVKDLINRPTINEADLAHYQQLTTSLDILNVSDIYLKSVNQLIRQYSESASLVYLYLPPPPPQLRQTQANSTGFSTINNSTISPDAASFHNTSGVDIQTTALISTTQEFLNEANQRYVRLLDTISDSLPPCVFVNGVSCVTSTHL